MYMLLQPSRATAIQLEPSTMVIYITPQSRNPFHTCQTVTLSPTWYHLGASWCPG